MPKPNYAFAKRQRELAKKQKKEAKAREREAKAGPADEGTSPPLVPSPNEPPPKV